MQIERNKIGKREIYKEDRLYLLKLAATKSGHQFGKLEKKKAAAIASNEEVWPIIESYMREVFRVV